MDEFDQENPTTIVDEAREEQQGNMFETLQGIGEAIDNDFGPSAEPDSSPAANSRVEQAPEMDSISDMNPRIVESVAAINPRPVGTENPGLAINSSPAANPRVEQAPEFDPIQEMNPRNMESVAAINTGPVGRDHSGLAINPRPIGREQIHPLPETNPRPVRRNSRTPAPQRIIYVDVEWHLPGQEQAQADSQAVASIEFMDDMLESFEEMQVANTQMMKTLKESHKSLKSLRKMVVFTLVILFLSLVAKIVIQFL